MAENPNAMELSYYGSEVLRKPAEPVHKVSDTIKALIDRMFVTMHENNGIGLAAPQVGVDKRVIVLDLSHMGIEPFALVNPVITRAWGGTETDNEGCLSIPGVYLPVCRPARIKVQGRDAKGRMITREASGLLARAIQHEIDHLDGKLFTDYVQDAELRQAELDALQHRLAEYRLKGDKSVLFPPEQHAEAEEPVAV